MLLSDLHRSRHATSIARAIVILSISLVDPAHAQLATSPQPVTIPEVTVTAPADTAASRSRPVKAPAAAQQSTTPRASSPAAAAQAERAQAEPSAVSVAPTGTLRPVEQIGSAVTVVTAQEIDAQQRRSATDVLKSVPGVNVVQSGGVGGVSSVFIRGANSNHSKVLIDGIDVSDPSSANRTFNFGQLTTFDLDRIEVLRGPQSGLYGADALGGVIVVYTKKGEGPLKVEGLVEGGSFGTFNQALSASGSTDRINYAFNVSHLRADTVRVTPSDILLPGTPRLTSNTDNLTYSGKVGIDITRELTFNFVGRYTQSALGFQGDSFSFIDFTNRPDPVKSRQNTEQLYTRSEAVWSPFGGRIRNTFGFNTTDVLTNDVSPTAGVSFGDGHRVKYDWRTVADVAPGVVMSVGADYQNETLIVPALAVREANSGVYVQAQVEPVRNLFLVGNVRHDDNESFGISNTWRFAPAYVFDSLGLKLKGSAGTAFKAPSLSQRFQDFADFGFFANRNLKPEESTGYDIGFEQAVFSNRAQFGATWFYNDITNLIQGTFDPVTFNSSVDNIGKARTTGVEVFASADVTDDLRLRADYTYTEAFDAETGKDLLRRPRHKTTLAAGWKPTPPLLLTGSINYIGPTLDVDRVTFADTTTPGFVLVNVAADYAIDPHASVFGRIDNLFDRRYQNPSGFEGTGIGAFVGVKLRN